MQGDNKEVIIVNGSGGLIGAPADLAKKHKKKEQQERPRSLR